MVFLYAVASYYVFHKTVVDAEQRGRFLLHLFPVGQTEGRLYVAALITTVAYKIYLKHAPDLSAFLVNGIHFHVADINTVASGTKLVVDGVFHEMRLFLLTETEQSVADA